MNTGREPPCVFQESALNDFESYASVFLAVAVLAWNWLIVGNAAVSHFVFRKTGLNQSVVYCTSAFCGVVHVAFAASAVCITRTYCVRVACNLKFEAWSQCIESLLDLWFELSNPCLEFLGVYVCGFVSKSAVARGVAHAAKSTADVDARASFIGSATVCSLRTAAGGQRDGQCH